MSRNSLKNLRLSSLDILLFVIYLALFIFFILQPPVYSPDTNSYFRLSFYRFPGYGIFLRVFDLIFGNFFDFAVVGFQLIFGFISIIIIAKSCFEFLKLNLLEFFALLSILTFPYFAPLLVGNNICAEGLSYPLYLLLISFSFDFFFRERQKRMIHISVVFILLCLTRGQFIIVAPILAVLFILKEKKNIIKRPTLFFFIIFLLLPVFTQTLDKSYHKIVHGYFVTTPFSYVNAITLPLFVSKKEDVEQLKTKDERTLFLNTYNTIESLGLLSSEVSGDAKTEYMVFHNNFPIICNQTFHAAGKKYLENKTENLGENVVMIEKAAMDMLPVLVKNNFKEYISIYFEGIFYGFNGILISVFALLLFLYSSIITLKKWSLYNGLLLFATTLIVSNAMIVAFASHSIMRYLFYNYFFAVLIGIILLRKITSKS